MSEELVQQLTNSKIQLQQVEAALYQDQGNEDLLKLKKDLQQVIELTKQLISSQTQPSSSLRSTEGEAACDQLHPSWKVGDDCLAIWIKDGQYYRAKIEEIDEENETAAISFAGYGNVQVTPLLNLKPMKEKEEVEEGDSEAKAKKGKLALQQENKRKKALKKVQRIKEMYQKSEVHKEKWQQFHSKACLKNKKGQVKKSIFASPETINGRVGIGTCGIADKPMTQFENNTKYNVHHLMPQ